MEGGGGREERKLFLAVSRVSYFHMHKKSE